MSPKQKPTMPVDLYVRVSRVAGRQGDSYRSPKQQEERCRKQLEADGLTAGELFIDEDQSGAKESRPAFDLMMSRVDSGASGGVIVHDLSRFGRNTRHVLDGVERIERAGGTFISCAEKLDTSTPSGRFVLTVLAALRQMELETIRERWDVTRRDAITRGVHIAKANGPVGYRRGQGGRLEPDPVAAPIVLEVFQRRAQGAAWSELCRLLDSQMPRPDGGAWPISSVVDLISRRTYLGEARAGDFVNPSAHPAIVPRPVWEAAQSPRSAGRSARSNGERALLSGLIVCSGCGKPMTRAGSGAKGEWMNYACQKRHSDGRCPEPTRISTLRADEYVQRLFLERWGSMAATSTPATGDLADLQAALEESEGDFAAFLKAARPTDPGYEEAVGGWRGAVEACQRRLVEAQTAQASGLMRVDLLEIWPDLSTGERRTILAEAIDRVTVRRGKLEAGKQSVGKGALVSDRISVTWR